jgi:hypothetical protein
MSPAVLTFLSLGARLLGRLKQRHFQMVLDWVEVEASKRPDSPGWQKADRVAERFRAVFEGRDGHVIRTVIQIAYSILKARGVIT